MAATTLALLQMAAMALCLTAIPVAARPGQSIVDSSDPSLGETLSYYGGAKGHFLLVGADGRRVISQTPPPLRAQPTKRPAKPVKPPKEDDEDVGMAPEGDGGAAAEDPENEVLCPPPDEAAQAYAKPVGISIAGVGGEAKSAPVGQAVVGDYGRAEAVPVAVAIAGVKTGGVPGAIAVPDRQNQNQNQNRHQNNVNYYDADDVARAAVLRTRYFY